MRYLIIVSIIGLGVSLIAFGLGSPPGDRLASFDAHHPAALLQSIDNHLHAFRVAATELARGLVDEFTSPYRKRLQRDGFTESPSR